MLPLFGREIRTPSICFEEQEIAPASVRPPARGTPRRPTPARNGPSLSSGRKTLKPMEADHDR